ncbi:MAG: hypothetical protein LC803_07240 [Acidobacteria bacterium]|nr:hypothetical protein [Acidobacteriota bacterium]
MFRTIIIAVMMLFRISPAGHQPALPNSQERDACSILSNLKAEFQKRNPNIAHVKIIDARPTLTDIPKYLVLGWGIRADRTFRGNFEDELFGLFLVDESLSKVEKVMDFIPTPRWYDTEMRIISVDATKAVVEAKGETYGVKSLRREYIMYNEGRIFPVTPNKSFNRTDK